MAIEIRLKLAEVSDLDDLLRNCDSPKGCIRRRSELWFAFTGLHIRGRRVASSRNRAESIAVAKVHCGKLRLANAGRIGEYGVERRLKLAGRRTDDAQDLRCSFLLLQRFVTLA